MNLYITINIRYDPEKKKYHATVTDVADPKRQQQLGVYNLEQLFQAVNGRINYLVLNAKQKDIQNERRSVRGVPQDTGNPTQGPVADNERIFRDTGGGPADGRADAPTGVGPRIISDTDGSHNK